MNTELTISLPQPLKDFIDARVAEGAYETPSDYVRKLVQEAHERAAEERLERLLLEGIKSGPATPMTKADWDEIRARGLAHLSQQQTP